MFFFGVVKVEDEVDLCWWGLVVVDGKDGWMGKDEWGYAVDVGVENERGCCGYGCGYK